VKTNRLLALALLLPSLAWGQDSPGSRWGYSVKNSNLPLVQETQFSAEQLKRQEALAKACKEELRGHNQREALDCLLKGLAELEKS